MDNHDLGLERDTMLYRLEIDGPVSDGWADWFEADTVTPRGRHTVLEVQVADQAELYGRLRRIHDLNLRLISVTRITGAKEDDAEEQPERNP